MVEAKKQGARWVVAQMERVSELHPRVDRKSKCNGMNGVKEEMEETLPANPANDVAQRPGLREAANSRAIGTASLALEQSSTPPHQGPKRCSCGGAICCDHRKRRRIPRARTRQTSRMDPRLCPAGKGWHFSWQRERTMFRLLVQSPGGSSAFRRNRQIALCHEKKQQPLWKGPLSIGPRSHPGWLVHPWLAGYLRQPKRGLLQPKRSLLRFAGESRQLWHLWLRAAWRQVSPEDAESRARCALFQCAGG